MKFRRVIIPAVFFVCTITCHSALAQRDAPVWDSYLSPISVRKVAGSLSAKFMLHKTGGPHEHFEHQCYMLLYLKQDEAAILKTIANPEFVNKKQQPKKPFQTTLKEQGLVVTLVSQVAKRIPDDQRTDAECDSGFCFRFEFEFKNDDLFEKLAGLKNFNVKDVEVAGKSTSFNDKFGLIVFVPVNDSVYATHVAAELQQTPDFANLLDLDTSILYFRPLPYNFGFRKYEDKLILSIN